MSHRHEIRGEGGAFFNEGEARLLCSLFEIDASADEDVMREATSGWSPGLCEERRCRDRTIFGVQAFPLELLPKLPCGIHDDLRLVSIEQGRP